MQQLKDMIRTHGKNLGGGILKVDSFINHQVDPDLMDACGAEFARRFADVGATRILTAEISGIAPALMTARHMDLPVVYARKTKPITMPDHGLPDRRAFAHQGPHGGVDRLAGIPGARRTRADHR